MTIEEDLTKIYYIFAGITALMVVVLVIIIAMAGLELITDFTTYTSLIIGFFAASCIGGYFTRAKFQEIELHNTNKKIKGAQLADENVRKLAKQTADAKLEQNRINAEAAQAQERQKADAELSRQRMEEETKRRNNEELLTRQKNEEMQKRLRDREQQESNKRLAEAARAKQGLKSTEVPVSVGGSTHAPELNPYSE
jgi:type IV secretory pathway VirB10-like protein